MNIETMTYDEKINLMRDLQKSLGWYPVMTICTEDLREHLAQKEQEPVSDESLHNACAYVARKYDIGDDWIYALEWAAELCNEKE